MLSNFFSRIAGTIAVAGAFFVVCSPIQAATFQKISPADGLGRIALQHLKMNGSGDFVAVSRSQVFIGNGPQSTVEKLFDVERTSFVLSASVSYNANSSAGLGEVHYADVDFLQTRTALNANGDFLIASNTKLWTGNVRTRTYRQVADAGSFAEFQSVAINDSGHYVAMAAEKVFAGKVTDQNPRLVVDGVPGNFTIYGLYSGTNRVDGTFGEQRLQLNNAGQYIVVTNSAVFAGDIVTGEFNELARVPSADIVHVELNEEGKFVVATLKDIYAGAF